MGQANSQSRQRFKKILEDVRERVRDNRDPHSLGSIVTRVAQLAQLSRDLGYALPPIEIDGERKFIMLSDPIQHNGVAPESGAGYALTPDFKVISSRFRQQVISTCNQWIRHVDYNEPDAPAGGDDDYKDGAWFTRNTEIPTPRLRMAAGKDRKSKRVRTDTKDNVVRYSVEDAKKWWPDDMKKGVKRRK